MVSYVDHEEKKCVYCGLAFKPKNIRSTRCYTLECARAHKAAEMRAYAAKVKERDGISITQKYRPAKASSVSCSVCKEPLRRYSDKETPVHKTCARPTESKAGLLHERFQRKIDKAAQGTNGGNRVFTSGPCTWCGEYFTAAAGVYCSTKCKISARFKRRSRGISFTISPVARRAIYERDAWTCQLCSNPVDPNAKHPNMWSASLDHIEPQSATLIPDHSPSNLRLTHLWCNAARGDGSNMAKEELISRASEMHTKAA